MTQWTPELGELLTKFANAEEAMLRDIINPESSRVALMLRSTFNVLVKINPLEKKLRAEAGSYSPYTSQIIALAEENNISLADKLKRNVAVQKQIDQIPENKWHRFRELKAIKKAGIQF
jgi:hypothetical protein